MTDAAFAGGWGAGAVGGDAVEHLTRPLSFGQQVASGHGRDRRHHRRLARRRRHAARRPARRAHGPRRGPPRRRARRPHHLLAEGVHPAHDALPRPVRLLHVRQAAGAPRRRPTSSSTRCSPSPGAAPSSAATRRCSRSARPPRTRYPDAAAWLAAHGYSSTVDYLVAAAGAVLAETGLLPHANAGALTEDELDAAPGGGAVAGDDDRDARRPPRRARRPARRRARQDARPPAGHARGRGPGPGAVHHRHPRRHRRDPPRAARRPARHPGRARAPRSRAGGDRPELPAQAGHVDVARRPRARPTSSSGPSPPPGSCSARRSTCRRRRTSPTPTTSARCVAAGIDDWGGVSPVTPDHVNPERPWPALDRLRDATEAAGHTLAPRLTVYPEYVRDGDAWLHDDVRFAVRCASDLEGLARDDALGGRRRRRAARAAPRAVPAGWTARARTPVGEVLDGVLAGEEVGVDEIVTLLGARGPDFARGRGGGRPAAPRRPSATRSRSSATATSTTRTSARSSAGSARSRRVRCRSTCAARPTSSTSRRSSAGCVEAVDCGATEVCLQGGIHPDFDGDYYLVVARAVKEVAPQIHVHGFTALEVTEGARRLGMPLARLPGAGEGRRARDAAGHRGRDPRRRGPGDHLPRQDRHRGVARRPPHRALGRAALERHDHVRPRRTARARRPPPRAHPRAAEGDRRLHRVRAAARSCTWPRRSSSSSKARKGPTIREVLLMHAVGRIAYRGWIDNVQVSWVKTGVARRAPGAAGRVQRPRRHADGREHLAGRRRQPRPGARRVGASARSSSRSGVRSSSAPRSTAAPTPRAAGCGPPPEAVEADRRSPVAGRAVARRVTVA